MTYAEVVHMSDVKFDSSFGQRYNSSPSFQSRHILDRHNEQAERDAHSDLMHVEQAKVGEHEHHVTFTYSDDRKTYVQPRTFNGKVWI